MVTLYEEALKEAFAANPIDEVVLHTLEFRHPSFVDDNGLPTAVRVVQGFDDITAMLESSAPLDAGKSVRFIACGFTFKLPSIKDGEVPRMDISIDNVSRYITAHLEQAIGQSSQIEVTYRPYLNSDLDAPQMDPPIHMVVSSARADLSKVTASATLSNVYNCPFPSNVYRPDTFPGLLR